MSKLTMSEAVAVIPVSESTLRRDLKRGKVSFDTDVKGRKQIDVSELTRVYGPLKPKADTAAEDNDTHHNPSMNGNDSKVIALLEGQVQDLKAQLAGADEKVSELLTLANNLQKQNEVLMLPPSKKGKSGWSDRLKNVLTTHTKETETA